MYRKLTMAIASILIFTHMIQAGDITPWVVNIHIRNQTPNYFQVAEQFPDCHSTNQLHQPVLQPYHLFDNHLTCPRIPRGILFLNGRSIQLAILQDGNVKVQGNGCQAIGCELTNTRQDHTQDIQLVLSIPHEPPMPSWMSPSFP